MSEPYRIPKREVPAEIVMAGRPPLAVTLFLADSAQTHDGYERLSDLLNGPKGFLPAADAEGKTTFLQRDALEVVTVRAEHEFGGDVLMVAALRSDHATARRVELLLADGSTLKGTVSYLMPVGRQRIQDFLNQPEPFIPLREGDQVRFVNKRHILQVSAD